MQGRDLRALPTFHRWVLHFPLFTFGGYSQILQSALSSHSIRRVFATDAERLKIHDGMIIFVEGACESLTTLSSCSIIQTDNLEVLLGNFPRTIGT